MVTTSVYDLPRRFRILMCFSAHELKAQVRYCNHAPSVRCYIISHSQNGIQRNLTGSKISTSSTKFVGFFSPGRSEKQDGPRPLIGRDIFGFSSVTAEQNSTKLDGKQNLNVLFQVSVFRADRKNKMAALSSD